MNGAGGVVTQEAGAGEEPIIYAVLPNYDLMVEALDARRRELGMSMAEFEALAGLATGAAAKYLGPSQTKKFGFVSLFKTVRYLGLRLTLEVEPAMTAKILRERRAIRVNQSRPGNYSKQVSKRLKQRVFREIDAILSRHPDRVLNWNEIKAAAMRPRPRKAAR